MLNDENFVSEVLLSRETCLVDFWPNGADRAKRLGRQSKSYPMKYRP